MRVGNNVLNTGGALRDVVEIRLHPDYIGGHNDVALLKLDRPVRGQRIMLAEPSQAYLWDGAQAGPFTPYDDGLVVGWGQTGATGPVPDRLQFRGVSILPPQWDSLDIKTIPVTGGPCFGDSGGPLLVNHSGLLLQVGVLKAANCSTSGSYSEVGAGGNRDWIRSNIPDLDNPPISLLSPTIPLPPPSLS